MGITHTGFATPYVKYPLKNCICGIPDTQGSTNVTFGRFMGSTRSDYSRISVGSNGNVYVDRYQNNGKGGAMVKGDGSRYVSILATFSSLQNLLLKCANHDEKSVI